MSNYKNQNSLSRALEYARALSNQTLVRPREAAAILGISRKHLYALANRPDFPERVRQTDSHCSISRSNLAFTCIGK